LTYASFAAFERGTDASVAHHTARLLAAAVLGLTIFLSAGSGDGARASHAFTTAAAAHHAVQ
jgi:hypothetical protein